MEIDDYIASTDEQLMTYALEGDSVAFEHLFNRYSHAIKQMYILRTGGNEEDADDLLQETFVKVFLNLRRYSHQYTFSQWIYTIARNTFIDYVRRRNDMLISIDKTPESGANIPVANTPTPEESMINAQNSFQLEQFMEKMTPRYRRLIELRFFREFSYEEISAELKMPLGTVKTRIHRAREQLMKYIRSSEGKDDGQDAGKGSGVKDRVKSSAGGGALKGGNKRVAAEKGASEKGTLENELPEKGSSEK